MKVKLKAPTYEEAKEIVGLSGQEEYLALKELNKKDSHCIKCGERIICEEDSICGRCI